jgi:single-stranded DNA-binding protein
VKYQSKGSKISVLGSLCVDKYQAGDKTRYKTYVRVNEIEFLGSKPKETQYEQIKATTRMNEDYNPELAIQESDLPW